MKYLVDKEKFAKLLRSRPSLVRAVVSPDEDFALSCFHLKKDESTSWRSKFEEIYLELPEELKTLAVTKSFIKTAKEFNVANIPMEILLKLSKRDRQGLLEKSVRSINSLPNTTYEEWLYVLENSYDDYEKVPVEFWVEGTALAAAMAASKYRHHFEFRFPETIWNQPLAIKMVTINDALLDSVPIKFINNEVLRLCLSRDLDGVSIPESAWDMPTAEKAVETNSSNIQFIPRQLITENINIIAASKGVCFDFLTIKTYPVIVAYIANNKVTGDAVIKAVAKIKDKETFILDVVNAQKDRFSSLFDLAFGISEDLWLKILKVNPNFIRHIERCNQTPAMVDTFLNTATAEIIDFQVNYINLGKIKDFHAPLLIGCENTTIQEIRNKYLKANAVNTPTEALIEIDLAPSEYAKIKGIL